MTVAELRAILDDVPGHLEVVLQADNYDDGRTAVCAATSISIEARGGEVACYIVADEDEAAGVLP